MLGRLYERGLDLEWSAVNALSARADGAADRPARRLRLPGHPMIPAQCWTSPPPVAEAAPVVPTRRAPERAEPAAQPGDAADWLRTVFTELLGTEGEITADTDYFALGGNSIIALQLIERVEARYGFRPKLLDVYEHPTVAAFAGLLTGATAGTAGPTAAPLPPVVPRSDPVMSFGQERMWFHHQLDKDTTLYNLPMVSHVRGPVDVAAVRGMWEGLAARHEVLRSNFVEVDGAPELRIRPELGDFFRYADVRTAPDPAAAARELVREAAEHRFDLAADPLVRVLVVRLAPEEHVIQVTMHHAVNDGGSPAVFARELPELYAAHREGRPPRLAPLPVQYRDYARWQRDLLRSAALDDELDYWKRQLDNAPVLELPTDHPRPARKDFAGALHTFSVPAADMRALRDLAARESVTLFVVLLAALYLLLARRSGQRDLIVGTPTTGRNRGELRDLIGFFNSTVALRADLSGDPELREVLHGVRAVVAEAMEHQEIPFDRVVHALGGERDLGRAPLFDVFYVHQDLPPIQQMDGASVGYFDVDSSPVNRFGGMPEGTAKFDLTLVTSDRAGDAAMDACLEFSTQLFTAGTAAGLVEEYMALLRRLAAPGSGGCRLSALLAPAPEAVPAPADELLVPTDRPRRPDGPLPVPSATVEAPLGAELAGELAAFASRRGPDGAPPHHDPLHLALITGWTVLLAWVCGQDEVSLGTPAGPLTVDLGDEPGFGSLLAEVGEALSALTGDERTPGLRVRCDGPQPPGDTPAPRSTRPNWPSPGAPTTAAPTTAPPARSWRWPTRPSCSIPPPPPGWPPASGGCSPACWPRRTCRSTTWHPTVWTRTRPPAPHHPTPRPPERGPHDHFCSAAADRGAARRSAGRPGPGGRLPGAVPPRRGVGTSGGPARGSAPRRGRVRGSARGVPVGGGRAGAKPPAGPGHGARRHRGRCPYRPGCRGTRGHDVDRRRTRAPSRPVHRPGPPRGPVPAARRAARLVPALPPAGSRRGGHGRVHRAGG